MGEIWLRKCFSWEEEAEADREFWARMKPAERVNAVEAMRRSFLATTGQADEGIKKVVRVQRHEKE